MTARIYRIPGNPCDDSCRQASVPGARRGQRGLAARTDGPFTEGQPAIGDQLHAGFRMDVRTP